MNMAHHPSESIPLTGISIESDASVVSPSLSPRTSLGADIDDFAKSESPPLPRRQIILLCYARLMEIIGLYSVFPYIAQMIQHIQQMPKSDVGFYSGLVESLFSVVEMAALPAWNKLSERIGRRPALVWSIAGMAVFTALFVTATSIAQLILYRCLAGVFSGSGLIIRTMIQEQTTADTQAVAFSWFAIADNIGTCVGPLIGGIFAGPAKMYPSVFGGIQFFRAYPYALPGIVVGVINQYDRGRNIRLLSRRDRGKQRPGQKWRPPARATWPYGNPARHDPKKRRLVASLEGTWSPHRAASLYPCDARHGLICCPTPGGVVHTGQTWWLRADAGPNLIVHDGSRSQSVFVVPSRLPTTRSEVRDA